jgi:hypothetical protein
MASVHPSFLFTPSPLSSRSAGVGRMPLAGPPPSVPFPSNRSASIAEPGGHRRGRCVQGGGLERFWGLAGCRPSAPLLLVILLVVVASLVAPEQPHDQEAICQRHSGEVACRVW